jgi:hypothetical protein
MALSLLQPGIEPVGQLDLMDGYAIRGGEIGTAWRASRTNTAAERAAFDARQGVTNATDNRRLVVIPYLDQNGRRPLWLLDDGSAGYGTLFGQTIGVPAGLSTTGDNLGPPTYFGSGKVTVWNKPGLYGITLDAVDTDPVLGLQPTNPTILPGDPLFPMANGRMTPTAARAAGGAIGADVVARFLEFRLTSNSLVTTPASLVGAVNAAYRFVAIEYNVEG